MNKRVETNAILDKLLQVHADYLEVGAERMRLQKAYLNLARLVENLIADETFDKNDENVKALFRYLENSEEHLRALGL